MLFSQSFALTAVGLAFMGLSTAFASGSLDALSVEDTVRRKGESELSKAISTLLIFQSAGLACGAVIGGFLPYVEGYALHLVLKCAVCLAVAVTALPLPRETRKGAEASGLSLRLHLSKMINLLRGNNRLKTIATCIVLVAVTQGALETYWQTQLSTIVVDGLQTVLGVLAAAAYLVTTLGCIILGHINIDSPKRSWIIYFVLSDSIAVLVALLSLAADVSIFAIIYIIVYLSIGMLSVSEQTLINRETSNDVRSSILSITSFSARMGVMVSGMLCSFLISGGSVSFVWRIVALVSASGLMLVSVVCHACQKHLEKCNISSGKITIGNLNS
jgi:predicted MFS family arabinose efflux permease